MNELIKLGKKRTILISISILLVSIHTIYFYHIVIPEIDKTKLTQQIIRFVLTFGLLYAVYKGKKWAKIISIILFSLALLGGLIALGTIDRPLINKVPLFVMVFVYSMAIYHFGFSESYKAFFCFKREEKKKLTQYSERLMDTDKFWEIIEISKNNSSGNYEKQQTELEKELLKLNGTEILEFDNKFRTLKGEVYNWNFFAAAYIINGACSDDCFSDFRGWLIGQGKVVFENAVENVESLAELKETNDGDWEGLSYIPTDAFEKKIGNDMPNGIQENFEITGVEWSEEGNDLKNKYPKLWEKFGIEL